MLQGGQQPDPHKPLFTEIIYKGSLGLTIPVLHEEPNVSFHHGSVLAHEASAERVPPERDPRPVLVPVWQRKRFTHLFRLMASILLTLLSLFSFCSSSLLPDYFICSFSYPYKYHIYWLSLTLDSRSFVHLPYV